MTTNQDNTEFINESKPVHWRDALRLERTAFVMNVKISKAMRTAEGFVREFTRKVKGEDEAIKIKFDEEFTFDKFLREFAEPLGYVMNGQLHPDFINGYLKRFTAWLATAGIQEQRQAIWKDAEAMSEKYGKSVEFYFEMLGGNDLGKPLDNDSEDVQETSTNGASKGRQTAKMK